MNNDTTLKSFAVKSIIIAIAAIIITCVAIGVFSVLKIIGQQNETVEKMLTSCAIAVSEVADGDVIRNLQPGDEPPDIYREYRRRFEHIAEEIELEYIFILRKNERGQYAFLFDTDPSTAMGDIYDIDDTRYIEEAFSGRVVVTDVYSDEWGTFRTGYSPIYDSAGNIAAIIGADYSVARLSEELRETIIQYVLMCLLVLAVIIAVFAVIIFISYGKINLRLIFVVKQLTESTGNISLSAGQLNRASENLADGSTRQAASIEETSATMNETSSMVTQNAENTKAALQIVQSALNIVRQAGQSMSELMNKMSDLKESSDTVNRIVQTIDDIAFQTNLLAINATVEAARAGGDAGRSFGVVAQEVRSLAQKSADSAADTTLIIEKNISLTDASRQAAKNVLVLAQKNGEQIVELEKLISEINAASGEQASGIKQINTAISNMEKVTQDNAAVAEENAASSNVIKDELLNLENAVTIAKSLAGKSKQ